MKLYIWLLVWSVCTPLLFPCEQWRKFHVRHSENVFQIYPEEDRISFLTVTIYLLPISLLVSEDQWWCVVLIQNSIYLCLHYLGRCMSIVLRPVFWNLVLRCASLFSSETSVRYSPFLFDELREQNVFSSLTIWAFMSPSMIRILCLEMCKTREDSQL